MREERGYSVLASRVSVRPALYSLWSVDSVCVWLRFRFVFAFFLRSTKSVLFSREHTKLSPLCAHTHPRV